MTEREFDENRETGRNASEMVDTLSGSKHEQYSRVLHEILGSSVLVSKERHSLTE